MNAFYERYLRVVFKNFNSNNKRFSLFSFLFYRVMCFYSKLIEIADFDR